MLKRTITYEDYDGNTRTEDFYFNLSKAELIEIEASTPGGVAAKLEKISKDNNGAEIIKTFKDIILKSYGVKSEDGKRFIKSEEISKAFEETEAYSELFYELALDADKAAAFVNGIMPRKLIEEANNDPELRAKIEGLKSGNE
jgi:hypothetical protein